MTALLKHPLSWLTIVAATLLCAFQPKTSTGQAAAKLPIVEDNKLKAFTEKLTGRVSFDMMPIPGGTYMMGSPADEKNREAHEGPQHPVTLKPFWIGKCEVTWDEYDLYWQKKQDFKKSDDPATKLADAVSKPTPPYADETFGHGRDNQPALCMTVHAAMHYCQWLSAKTGKRYRLPTEAEWEWACRAGTTTPWFFGNDEAKLGDYAWFEGNSDDKTHVVAKKKPNPWGLYDIYGNVAEWCVDYYQADYYAKFPTDKASLQPVNQPRQFRYPYVVRGGSWSQGPERCRSATRLFSDREWLRRDPQQPQSIWWMTDADFVGFRVVCVENEQEDLRDLKSKITRESEDNEPKKKAP
ncbi:MAG: formylglycine-generating enzyme family protein [Planctomycetota bacterium]